MLVLLTGLAAMMAGPQLLGHAVWRLTRSRRPRLARALGIAIPPLAFLAFSVAVWSTDAGAAAPHGMRGLWQWAGLGLTTTLGGTILNTGVALALHLGELDDPEEPARA